MKIVIIMSILLLAGCIPQKAIIIGPPPQYEAKITEPIAPEPVKLQTPTFSIITPQNSEAYFSKNPEGAVFGVTPQGYEILSLNIQELRRYILELQETIKAYQKLLRAESAPQE